MTIQILWGFYGIWTFFVFIKRQLWKSFLHHPSSEQVPSKDPHSAGVLKKKVVEQFFCHCHFIFSNIFSFFSGCAVYPLFTLVMWIEFISGFVVFMAVALLSLTVIIAMPFMYIVCLRPPSWFTRFWKQYWMILQGAWKSDLERNIPCCLVFLCFIPRVLYSCFWAPPCLFLTLIEEVTTISQLESWYKELRKNQFHRMVLIQPAFQSKQQKMDCPEIIARNSLKLKRENLQSLQECGLKIFLVPACNFTRNCLQLFFPFSTSAVLSHCRTYLYHHSLFVSHRWAADSTWYGENGWQFREVLTFVSKHSQIKFMWVDGLCAPQDESTMIVIDHLSEIIKQCYYFISIDGSYYDATKEVRSEERYLSRVWCLYELYLGRCSEIVQEFFVIPESARQTRTKNVVAVFPDNLNLTLLTNEEMDNDKFIESLFGGAAFQTLDKNRIILNVLEVPMFMKSCWESILNFSLSVLSCGKCCAI